MALVRQKGFLNLPVFSAKEQKWHGVMIVLHDVGRAWSLLLGNGLQDSKVIKRQINGN